METTAASAKKPKAGKIVLWVLLTPLLLVLLAALVLVGALLLGGYDTPIHLDAQGGIVTEADFPAMPLSKRYSFDARERTVTIRADANDLMWLVEKYGEEKLPELNELLAGTPLTLQAIGFQIEDGRVLLNGRLQALGFLPIPVQGAFTLEARGVRVHLAVEELAIAKLVRISVQDLAARFGLDEDALRLTLDLSEYHKRLEMLKSVAVTGGAVELTCGIGTELFSEMAENPATGRRMSLYLEPTPVLQLAKALSAGSTGEAELDGLLDSLESDPAYYSSLRGQLLAATEPFKAKLAYEGKGSELMERFLPDADKAAVLALRDRDAAVTDEREALFNQLVSEVAAAWHEGRLIRGAGGFFDQSGAPADVTTLAEDWAMYSPWLDPGKTRIILANHINYFMYNRLKPLTQMGATEDAGYAGLEQKGWYEAVLLVGYIDGTYAVACREGNSDYGRHEMDRAAYQALMDAPNIPVFDLMIKDY